MDNQSDTAIQNFQPETKIPLQQSISPKILILLLILCIILVVSSVLTTALFKNSNVAINKSDCVVAWTEFPSIIEPDTEYTIYINKISAKDKWRDVSVFMDLDINPGAKREPGLTGDDWQNPSDTYTFTFNSGQAGIHKLYFYNNDFKSYGENSGTGPKTLCNPVYTYATNKEFPLPIIKEEVLEPMPQATEAAETKTYSNNLFSVSLPKDFNHDSSSSNSGNLVYSLFTSPDDFHILLQAVYDPSNLRELNPNEAYISLDDSDAIQSVIITGQAADTYQPMVETEHNGIKYNLIVWTKDNQINRSKADTIMDELITSFRFTK